MPPQNRPTLIAHREVSADAPRHSVEAYWLARARGIHFVELDLQVTKRGVLLCLHDTTLKRTTDARSMFPDRGREANGRKSWPVANFTTTEIQTLDARS